MPRSFTVQEDAEILRLKERRPFGGWEALARTFNLRFAVSARLWGTLQVHNSLFFVESSLC
jgi:hypothetical protein